LILLIDNYDSFAHNLARYLRQLGQEVLVARNDVLSLAAIGNLNPAAIVMSPGPCTPEQSGICLPLIRELHAQIPMLGVCLGHQAICQALGARIVRSFPVHGQAAAVQHEGHPLFQDMETPFLAGRYHSLIAETASIPPALKVIATTATDQLVMAVAHCRFPVYGVQFHPESVLTPGGYQLLGNFLKLAGFDYNRNPPDQISVIRPTTHSATPANPGWPAKQPQQYQ
jgi:anthranilate synthase/aminodeoxychorismate synthase-like glutamine amidotransferase